MVRLSWNIEKRISWSQSRRNKIRVVHVLMSGFEIQENMKESPKSVAERTFGGELVIRRFFQLRVHIGGVEG